MEHWKKKIISVAAKLMCKTQVAEETEGEGGVTGKFLQGKGRGRRGRG